MVLNIQTGSMAPKSRPPVRIGGMRGTGLGLSCPPGQTPTNWYDGSVKCCGGPTPESDPCSFLNVNQGYIATQTQAQQDAIAGSAGLDSATLAAIAGYPQNVQKDALRCQNNPGQSFTDDMGMQVTCPAPGNQNLSGGYTSIYTVPQLASMLSMQATPTIETPINLVDVTNSGQTSNALVNTTPKPTSVNPGTNPGNALSTGAGQTSTSNTPTQQQIANGNNMTGNTGNIPSDVTVGGVDVTTWLSQNWILVAAGAAALLILPGLMKGGR